MTERTGTVASLHRFPVKSMLGEDLEVAVVDARGLAGDRGYALIDTTDGGVVSAKHPRKWATLLQCRARYVDEPSGDGPLPPVVVTLPDGTDLRSDEPTTDAALSRFLGRDVRVTSDVADGAAYEAVWPDGLAPDDFIAGSATESDEPDGHLTRIGVGLASPDSFVDVAALHLITSATLASLRAEAPGVDQTRFRANVVIDSGGDGFPENDWPSSVVRLGSVQAAVLIPTMRCVMPSLAHGDLPVDRAVVRAVSAKNRREIPGLGTWSCAGVYAAVAEGGEVRVGDSVEITTSS